MLYTTTQSFKCILEQEYQLLLKDVIKYSNIQRADERLFEEVEEFLESIRASRRELVREQAKLKNRISLNITKYPEIIFQLFSPKSPLHCFVRKCKVSYI